jgi:fatty acid desaturase
MTADEDFRALKAHFRSRGWYERPTARVVTELALHVGTFVIGVSLIAMPGGMWLDALGLLLVTLGHLGVGTSTHTSAHAATSRTAWVNDALTYFGYPFFLQVSATYWWDKHNVRHHPNANVITVDPDIDPSPWVALTRWELERQTGVHRWYYDHQGLFFPVLIAFNGLGFQLSGWTHLLTVLADRDARTRRHWLDLTALALHWLAWIAVPATVFALSDVLLFHLARAVTMGYALFAVLAPCHFPAEAQVLTPESWRRLDFIGRQTTTSINFRTGAYGRLLCSGLDYHIEHHLLPSMCHVYYPQASPLVEEFCRKHGYPYRSFGWGQAIWKAYANVRSPKAGASTDAAGLARHSGVGA